MTLPSPIQTGAITGHFADEAGRPLKGSVILRYGRQVLLAPAASPPTTIITRTKAYELDDNGDLAAEDLVLADSDGLRRKGFKMEAKFALTDQEGHTRPRASVWFQLTKAEPEKDITTISTDEPDGGYPVFPELHGTGPGGAPGQVWGKLSAADWDAGWIDAGSGPVGDYVTEEELADALQQQLDSIRQLPTGGVDGQFLGHVGGAPTWATIPGGGTGGDYPPITGIPFADLSLPLQTSMQKADSALQAAALDPYATAEESEAALEAALANYATTAALNAAIDGITPAAIGAQPAGNYALASSLNAVNDHLTEVETTANAAAPKNSPALTGIPTAPTAALGTNSNQIATMAAIKQAVDALVAGAPGALDTLKEIADALAGDDDALAALTTAVGTKVPQTRTINGHALSADVNLTAPDVGAAATAHTHVASQISDSTSVGRGVLTAADAAAARGAIGAGTSSLALGTSSSTAKAGDWKPAAADITDAGATGRAILQAATVAAARAAENIYVLAAGADASGLPANSIIIQATGS